MNFPNYWESSLSLFIEHFLDPSLLPSFYYVRFLGSRTWNKDSCVSDLLSALYKAMRKTGEGRRNRQRCAFRKSLSSASSQLRSISHAVEARRLGDNVLHQGQATGRTGLGVGGGEVKLPRPLWVRWVPSAQGSALGRVKRNQESSNFYQLERGYTSLVKGIWWKLTAFIKLHMFLFVF